MLPTPLTSDWSSSARLIPVRLRRSAEAKTDWIERGLERIGRDVRDGCGQVGSAPHQAKVAERALIHEPQVGPGVGKGESGAHVAGERAAWLADQQLPAHAEMGEQRVIR